MSEEIITQHDVENKQLKEENEKVESKKEENEKVDSRKVENRKDGNEQFKKENEKLRKNYVDAKIKESIKKHKEIKIIEEDNNTTDWFDKNKFKKFLAITDSNKFNYRNKIGEFKYICIRDLVNNIINITISEISVKIGLNTLNEIKDREIIKYKNDTPKLK